jgi:hypothetical protein
MGLTWVVVRTYDEFFTSLMEYIEEHHEFPPLIVLNSNLDDQQQWWFETKKNLGKIPKYDAFKNKSGMHVLSFIMEFSDTIKLYPKKIHTGDTTHANHLLAVVYNKWVDESQLPINHMPHVNYEMVLPATSVEDIVERNNDLSTLQPKEKISKGGIILPPNG